MEEATTEEDYQFIDDTFGTLNWLCPDTRNIQISGNAEITGGKNFFMVVNSCDKAKSIEQSNNITSYYTQFDGPDDKECYSLATV